MSEIPKLNLYNQFNLDNGETTIKLDLDTFIKLKDLQEVNAFWDKYKDDMDLFFKDYPEFIEKFIKYRQDNFYHILFNTDVSLRLLLLLFRDWLHDLLYKECD